MMEFYADFKATHGKENFVELFNNTKVVRVITGLSDVADYDQYFRELACLVGTPLIYEEDPVTGKISPNKWTEIKFKEENRLESYKHSNKYQPLHTDYGYYSFEIYTSFFYCVTQAKFGGATTFIDADKIVEILTDVDPSLLNQLQNTPIHFGRKDNPLTNFTDYILSKDEFGWRINWNYYRALTDTNNQDLIAQFKTFLDNHIEKSGELLAVKLKPGEGVFFKDRRVLHGRNSFTGQRQLNKGGIALNIPQEVYQYVK